MDEGQNPTMPVADGDDAVTEETTPMPAEGMEGDEKMPVEGEEHTDEAAA